MWYEHDIKGLATNVGLMLSGIWGVYTGPRGGHINGYERVGRIFVGTLLAVCWVGFILCLTTLAVAAPIVVIYTLFSDPETVLMYALGIVASLLSLLPIFLFLEFDAVRDWVRRKLKAQR